MKFYKMDELPNEIYNFIIQEHGYGQKQAEKIYKKKQGEKKVKMWQLRYYDSCGSVVALLLWARTKQSLLNKFQRDYGYYTIIDIKEIEQ